ncbi:serine--tRNA ligase, mitochondrial [Lingula anatina]|uniref:serine--tRNA ligase n=1 Tax=Lingula anatina TaxID=7574 RepID=A0A1S3JQN9_LINAN|nr:serine--tRNA ligase, mitochondrial [Lingula anatina]|eukprot:XP_013412289.1 serine--tRNA ligase, mitochondrial [Lingula anatina]
MICQPFGHHFRCKLWQSQSLLNLSRSYVRHLSTRQQGMIPPAIQYPLFNRTNCIHRNVQNGTLRNSLRGFSNSVHLSKPISFHINPPELNIEYLLDPCNKDIIQKNIMNRKGESVDLGHLIELKRQYEAASNDVEKKNILSSITKEASSIPNNSHPDSPIGDEAKARLVKLCGEKKEFNFKCKSHIDLCSAESGLDLLKVRNVGQTTGNRTYYLKGDAAQMQQALIKYTVPKLLNRQDKSFTLISVPDMLHPDIIEACGFKTTGDRTQVYTLDQEKHGQICLSGTAEMALGGFYANRVLDLDQLPQRVCAVSRCYRAETSNREEEKGIYRVHQFTKVEMFGVTADETGTESEELLKEFIELQEDLYDGLGLHFRILDMPTEELGAPAYRKYDMEAWMPEKQFWGEISSSSNCTDYQSRRLHIKYRARDGSEKFVHTVNGTACAVPRLIMAIVENSQNEDGTISIPQALQKYMFPKGKQIIEKPEKPWKTQYYYKFSDEQFRRFR